MKFEDLQINNLEAESKLKSEKIERPTEFQTAETNDFDLSKEIVQSEIKDAQEIQKVRQEIASVPETEIPPTAQEKNTEIVEQKTNWLASKLDTAKRYLKVATLGAGVFMGANKLEASNINEGAQDKLIDQTEQVPSVDNKNEKSIDGGNIAEVVVYGRKKYEESMLKQQADMEKYAADLGKYKKDSTEWVKANEAYQDSLRVFNDMPNVDPKTGLPRFLNYHSDRVEESIPFTHTVADEVAFYKKHPDHGWAYFGEKDALGRNWNDHKILPEKIVYWGGPETKKFDKNAEYWGANNGHLGLGIGVYKKPTNEPIPPQKPESPKTEKIKYDPKYEDLNMRSLWATMVKKNPNEKIGTLHNLDPNFEKGFTLDEAMSFPQEIKDKYNIDYIYNQIKGKQ
ncbi:MAG: hypothetical protein WCW61_00755 [Patescibacteria group bacterium]|jgi:hypothetical protein